MSGFNASLGIRRAAGGSRLELAPRPEHEAAPDTIHFAVLATLAEIAAAESVGAAVVPTAVSLSLMARARSSRPLVGRGRLLRRGRRLAVAEGEVSQGERLVAKALVTFAILESDGQGTAPARYDRGR